MASTDRHPSARPLLTLGVLAAGGGRGCSTLAGGLAVRAAAAGHETVLVDLVASGGGIDVLLGIEERPGPRWPDLAGVRGAVDGAPLLAALPTAAPGLAVLSFDRVGADPPVALRRQVVRALVAAVDVAVLDLGCDGVELTDLAQETLVLLSGDLTSLAAAQRLFGRLEHTASRPWLVSRGVPHDLEARICEELQAPLVRRLPDEGRLATDVRRGLPPAARRHSGLGRAADDILRALLGAA